MKIVLNGFLYEEVRKAPRKPSTHEFKGWVGSSRLPVQYHATTSPERFNSIDLGRSDLGFHVGTYEQAYRRLKTLNALETGRIIPFWINMRNPLKLKDEGSFHANAISGQLLRLKLIDRKMFEEINMAGYQGDKKYNAIIRDIILKAGYDGVVYKNTMEGNALSYIVIDPTTIKIASGNSGKFDRTSHDFTQESIEERNVGKRLSETSKEKYAYIYRATNNTTFHTNDYVTLSGRFAIEHAESNHVVNDEQHVVIKKMVKTSDVAEATNPGEYFYIGPDVEGKVVYTTLGPEEYEGKIPRI